VALRDAIPEIIFLNSHDGTTAWQLRMAIYRAVCTNGLIVSRGAFPAVCVAHRGDIVDAVIQGALRMAEQFDGLAAQVELMEARLMSEEEQQAFAHKALAVRFADAGEREMQAQQLLVCRRPADQGHDLWRVFNRCQLCGAPHNCTYVDATFMWSNGVWERDKQARSHRHST
jgi:Domain of unknown function (DUF932)